MVRSLLVALVLCCACEAQVVSQVRAAINSGDFGAAERILADYRSKSGLTPEYLEAYSWLGRGALAAKQTDRAEKYAAETKRMAIEQLKTRALDAEPRLPIALGAAIEVEGHVFAARGERDQAVAYLQEEARRYRDTSIMARIQKNINLLSLEGKPAPALSVSSKGKPALLFFWAHWCADCKQQGAALARIQQEFGPAGLMVIGPTRLYGYTAGGQEANPAEERQYIDTVRQRHYSSLAAMPTPIDEEVFNVYGVSTTPTLVLVDRSGIVRLYHPGKMSYEELAPRLRDLVGSGARTD